MKVVWCRGKLIHIYYYIGPGSKWQKTSYGPDNYNRVTFTTYACTRGLLTIIIIAFLTTVISNLGTVVLYSKGIVIPLKFGFNNLL